MVDISAVALFCDDIREEKMGGHTIIGVMGDNVALPEFPVVLPKLGIYLRLHIPTSAKPEKYEIYLNFPNGNRVLVSTIEHDLVEDTINKAVEAGNGIAGIISQLIASQFPIEQPGRIEAELEWSDRKMIIGSLNFLVSEQTPIAPTA
jgi:hypothetical protein